MIYSSILRGAKRGFTAGLVAVAALMSAPGFNAIAGLATISVGVMVAGEALAATNKGVGGVGIKVCKRPGGSSARCKPAVSGPDGSFKFTGLEAGNYDLTIGDAKPKLIVVGKNGVLAGKVFGDKNKAGVMQYEYKPQKADGSLD